MRDEKTLKQIIVMNDISDGILVSSAMGTYVNSYSAPRERSMSVCFQKTSMYSITLRCFALNGSERLQILRMLTKEIRCRTSLP